MVDMDDCCGGYCCCCCKSIEGLGVMGVKLADVEDDVDGIVVVVIVVVGMLVINVGEEDSVEIAVIPDTRVEAALIRSRCSFNILRDRSPNLSDSSGFHTSESINPSNGIRNMVD